MTSKGDSEISNTDMLVFLNSLEYGIKKQMKDIDKNFRNPNASSLKSKIPAEWIGIKFSSLSARAKTKTDEYTK